MIYDCFTFFNELEILDIRFEELDPVVDCFVIVESDYTFSGKPKESFFKDNMMRYAKYINKIKVVNVEADLGVSAWQREFNQRNGIMHGLENKNGIADTPDYVNDDDIILISDADEIPRRSVIENMDQSLPVQGFGLPAYYYGLNVSSGDQHSIRAVKYSELKKSTPQNVRTLDVDSIPCQWDAGWHFSYLGDVEHIIKKFQSFAHTELDRPDTTDAETVRARMKAGGDLWGDGHVYDIVEIDETWPEAIKKNRERWRRYEW